MTRQPAVAVVFRSDSPDTIERFLVVDEVMKELLLVFQIFFGQHSQGEYLSSGTT